LSSIKLDLLRRDFSINTLALRLDGRHYGELYDYWGGLDDLQNGIIRVLHSLSFVDDPTRILRAVRFEQRFGFTIEDRTLELLQEAKSLLKQVSGDRLRHEFDQILRERLAWIFSGAYSSLDYLKPLTPDLFFRKRSLSCCNLPWGKQWMKNGIYPKKVGNSPRRNDHPLYRSFQHAEKRMMFNIS
jgi:tRNA nucleotidyltransferase (CCA-adding enzyme)